MVTTFWEPACPAHWGRWVNYHQTSFPAAVYCPSERKCCSDEQPKPRSSLWKGWGNWVVICLPKNKYLWFIIFQCTFYVSLALLYLQFFQPHGDFTINWRLKCHLLPSFRWPITSEETVLFAKRVPWFHSNDSVPEIAVQRGAFAATVKVATSEIWDF